VGINAALYGKGEAVAACVDSGGVAYLGKDVLGSVRTVTGTCGQIEERYEYDAFGKPYDTATGLYNYGYRDYQPEAARFTTVDPIRDGTNWFVYVNNDPVNWVDLWGLNASDKNNSLPVNNIGKISGVYAEYRMQDNQWTTDPLGSSTIGKLGCKVTSAAQLVSTIIGEEMTPSMIASKLADANGNLSQAAIAGVLAQNDITVVPDYWEKQLNIDTLNNIKNNNEGVTYILGRADIGGGVGEHWVTIEDFSIDANGMIIYEVNGSSRNDDGNSTRGPRQFTSGSNNNSARIGTINRIETYTVFGE
jgi:RHS repeat-associated protein